MKINTYIYSQRARSGGVEDPRAGHAAPRLTASPRPAAAIHDPARAVATSQGAP